MKEATNDRSLTFISEHTEISADLYCQDTIRISGTLEGEIRTEGRFILKQSGIIRGNTHAQNADITGTIHGDVYISDKLTLYKNSYIKGNIYAKRIEMNEGARIDGKLNIGTDTEIPSKTPAKSVKSKSKPEPEAEAKPDPVPEQKEEGTSGAVTKEEKPVSEKTAARQRGNATPKDTPEKSSRAFADVLISLPQQNLDKSQIEKIRKSGNTFMEALGFRMEVFDEPKHTPFLQRLKFVLTSEKSNKDLKALFRTGKQALEAAYLRDSNQNIDKELYEAARSLIDAVDNVEEAVLMFGDLLLVQVGDEESLTVVTETTPPPLIQALDKKPEIAADPKRIYNFLKAREKE